MNMYRADVTVLPKDGVLDIQGKAVEKTFTSQGFTGVEEVRVGKFIRIALSAENESEAREKVRAMAEDLLVNDLVESYSFTLEAR